MTDSLRDQIAKALLAADRRLAQEDELPIELYYPSLADAVIAALGLKHYCRDCGGWGPMDD